MGILIVNAFPSDGSRQHRAKPEEKLHSKRAVIYFHHLRRRLEAGTRVIASIDRKWTKPLPYAPRFDSPLDHNCFKPFFLETEPKFISLFCLEVGDFFRWLS